MQQVLIVGVGYRTVDVDADFVDDVDKNSLHCGQEFFLGDLRRNEYTGINLETS